MQVKQMLKVPYYLTCFFPSSFKNISAFLKDVGGNDSNESYLLQDATWRPRTWTGLLLHRQERDCSAEVY